MSWSSLYARYHGELALRWAGAGAFVAAAALLSTWGPGRGGRRTGGWAAVGVALAGIGLAVEHYVTPEQGLALAAAALVAAAAGRATDRSVVGWLGLVSLVGVWAAVPDTEPALVAAAVLAVGVVSGVVDGRSIGDRLALLVLVVVTAWIGARGRDEVVGGLACGGLLLVLPRREDDVPAPVVVGLHAAVVLVASRWVTRLPRGWAVPVAVALLVAGAVVVRRLSGARRAHP